MTSPSKGKDQPIEDQMQESWNRSVDILSIMQVLFFIEFIVCSAVLLIVSCVSFYILHFTMDHILFNLYLMLGMTAIVMGSTFGIGLYSQNKMLKEYD